MIMEHKGNTVTITTWDDRGIDYRFWSLFHFDFYKIVILAKEKKIVQMKYIDWDHIDMNPLGLNPDLSMREGG